MKKAYKWLIAIAAALLIIIVFLAIFLRPVPVIKAEDVNLISIFSFDPDTKDRVSHIDNKNLEMKMIEYLSTCEMRRVPYPVISGGTTRSDIQMFIHCKDKTMHLNLGEDINECFVSKWRSYKIIDAEEVLNDLQMLISTEGFEE
jgi:hypothetical protein